MLFTSSPLKRDWQQILYSAQDTPQAKRTGAAVYWAKDGTRVLINTGATGLCKTITRMELAALRTALTGPQDNRTPDEDLTIPTDSLTSLHLINKAIRTPMRLSDHKLRELLEEIVQRLVMRSEQGLYTTLGKVKAHIGIQGNE